MNFFNAKHTTHKLVRIATADWDTRFVFKVQTKANVDTASSLLGDGWRKLGFNIPSGNLVTHSAVRIYDLSLPPAIVIKIQEVGDNIVSSVGTGTFVIPL